MRIKAKIAGGREPERVEITTDFIKLDAFLKLAAVCQTGGAAKIVIADGSVSVNGEKSLERGKKLRPGDTVAVAGRRFEVAAGKKDDDGQ